MTRPITTVKPNAVYLVDEQKISSKNPKDMISFLTVFARSLQDSYQDLAQAINLLSVYSPQTTLDNISTLQGQTSTGVYTPTLTNTTNISASTPHQCQWMRVADMVSVSGYVDIDPTAAGFVILGISLPVASNFGAVSDAGGVAATAAVAGQSAGIYADPTNDRASMQWNTVDTLNRSMIFTFMYRVI